MKKAMLAKPPKYKDTCKGKSDCTSLVVRRITINKFKRPQYLNK